MTPAPPAGVLEDRLDMLRVEDGVSWTGDHDRRTAGRIVDTGGEEECEKKEREKMSVHGKEIDSWYEMFGLRTAQTTGAEPEDAASP
jgi:hypothetical protein